ncbi:MAG: Ldh family oxidoreductase [Bacteroidetes bacterium]|nr:Ldh family oxidoreductase [Bacteroidota bacterium]MCL5024924.1 Ldh family oxidoreductase [Chloroflexota bacterium]
MPGVESGKLYPPEVLRSFAAAVFEKVGVSQEDAALVADSLIEANLRGVDTHGVTRMLCVYVKRVQAGLIRAKTMIMVTSDRPSVALLDGHNSLGQVVSKRAMTMAIEKAARTGCAVAGVTNSNHFGASAYYSMMALAHDQIGIAMTNSPAFVPPWGGRQPMFGTNPLSIAFPGDKEGSVVLDMATTTVARGRIVLYDKQNIPLDPGWAFDAAGRPTTDPHEAMKGLLQPLGGYKGYGLALAVDLLTGILTGGDYSFHMGGALADDFSRPTGVGSFFGAIAVDAFMDPAEFKRRVDRVIREIHESPKAEGVSRIYIPGEIEAESTARRLKEGIPLPAVVVKEFVELGDELGVPFPA